MNTKKSFIKLTKISFTLFILLAIFFASCKSAGQGGSQKTPQQACELYKYPDCFLWRIDGVADDGTPSRVYLLGTYHAGDDRGIEFPKCVLEALEESDRFVGELSTPEFNSLSRLSQSKMLQSLLTDLSHTLIDELSQEEIMLLTQYVDSQYLAQLVCFEPWVLNISLQSVLQDAAGLDTNKAYDLMVMDYIKKYKDNRGYEGLDENAQFQIDLIAWGDWDIQMAMLRDTIEYLKDIDQAANEMKELYELFLLGDEPAFTELYYSDFEKDMAESPFYKDYYKQLLTDRNEKWAVKIADYLKEPGTTFVFAGSAHFTGPDSVFAFMRSNGDLLY